MAFDLYNGTILGWGKRKIKIRSDSDIAQKRHFEVPMENFRFPYTKGSEVTFGRGNPPLRTNVRVIFLVRVTERGFVHVVRMALLEQWEEHKRLLRSRRESSRRRAG